MTHRAVHTKYKADGDSSMLGVGKLQSEIICLHDALPIVKAIINTVEGDIEQLHKKKP
jgi:hypothetical protein